MSDVTLTMPASDLKEKLGGRIIAATELLGLPRSTPADVDEFRRGYIDWDDYNKTLLEHAFQSSGGWTADTPAKEYVRAGMATLSLTLIRTTRLQDDMVPAVVADINAKHDLLQSLIKKVDLYKQSPTAKDRTPWTRSEFLSAAGIVVSTSSLSVATAVAISSKTATFYVPIAVVLLAVVGAGVYFKRWRALMVSLACVLAAAGGLAGGYQIWGTARPTASSDMVASLATYGDKNTPLGGGASVPAAFSLRGTVDNTDGAQDLWVLVAQENDTRYYLQPGPCAVSGDRREWTCSSVIVGRDGADVGSRWQLFVVRAPKSVSDDWTTQLRNRNVNVSQLPIGVVRLDSKSVVRR